MVQEISCREKNKTKKNLKKNKRNVKNEKVGDGENPRKIIYIKI